MSWDEFQDLLTGLGPDTPLGRMVSIRSEDDPEMLKLFSPEQMAIRSRWLSRRAKERSSEECQDFLAAMKAAFRAMAGGGTDGR